jgi:hypothetical protein
VKDLPAFVKENVSIMPIFGLKEVHNQTISSQTSDKYIFSLCQIINKI